jgi:hypothetical protein
MNLQAALNKAAKKYHYNDYLHAQTLSHNNNPWWFVDEVILGDSPDTELSAEGSKPSLGGRGLRNGGMNHD